VRGWTTTIQILELHLIIFILQTIFVFLYFTSTFIIDAVNV